MSVTTTNMALTSWNLASDTFQRAQLHANWLVVDAHDHTTGKGVQIPTAGIANGAVTGAKIAASTIGASNIAAASIPDASLASPMNAAYKPISYTQGNWDGTSGTWGLAVMNGGLLTSAGTNHAGLLVIPWVNADYAVPGMTTKLRMRYNWARNSVAASGSTAILCSLRTLGASSGTAGNIVYTFGSSVLASQYTIASAAVNAVGTSTSTDFTLADGNYFFSFSSPSVSPAGFGISIGMTLQVHHTL